MRGTQKRDLVHTRCAEMQLRADVSNKKEIAFAISLFIFAENVFKN